MKVILENWNPENKTVVTATGFRYRSTDSVLTSTKEIEGDTDIIIFEKFYKLNHHLTYCNGSYYKFQDVDWEEKYKNWLQSEDYKSRSFALFYGSGIVD